jgi:hypothetical protein
MIYYHGTPDPLTAASIAAGIKGRLYVTQHLWRAVEYAAKEVDYLDCLEAAAATNPAACGDALEDAALEIYYSRASVVVVISAPPGEVQEDQECPRMCDDDPGDIYLSEGATYTVVGTMPAIEGWEEVTKW